MNSITLIGFLHKPLTYHCTVHGQDLVRFELCTSTAGRQAHHHCLAWGPAALDLHRHLQPGDRLLLRGELQYRSHPQQSPQKAMVPEIYVRTYTYLGKAGK